MGVKGGDNASGAPATGINWGDYFMTNEQRQAYDNITQAKGDYVPVKLPTDGSCVLIRKDSIERLCFDGVVLSVHTSSGGFYYGWPHSNPYATTGVIYHWDYNKREFAETGVYKKAAG